MKLWVDDIREPPDDTWMWAKTSAEALLFLTFQDPIQNELDPLTEMSLDHDLGDDDTTRPVVLWMCENEWWPDNVRCHSANPVGVEWIEGMIRRYKPLAT